MGALYKLKKRANNGVVYAHFTDTSGKLHRKSCDTRDLKVARERAQQIVIGTWHAPTPAERIQASRADVLLAENITMDKLFDRCLADRNVWAPNKCRSQQTIHSTVRILCRIIGKERVRDMTYHRLEALADQLRKEHGYKEATIDRKMASIGKALTMATTYLDAQSTPLLLGRPKMPSFSYDNRLDKVASPIEEQAIFDALAAREVRQPNRDWKRFGMLIRFLFDQGGRVGEVTRLKNDEVHFPPPTMVGERLIHWVYFTPDITKNKKPRKLPLTPAVVAMLPYLQASAGEGGYMLPFYQRHWYRWNNIRKDVKAATGLDPTEIDKLKTHTLRHTNITRMARRSGKKGDIHKISQWAGHANIKITADRYAHLLADDLVDLL